MSGTWLDDPDTATSYAARIGGLADELDLMATTLASSTDPAIRLVAPTLRVSVHVARVVAAGIERIEARS